MSLNHSKDIIILGYAGTAKECPFDTETWGINQAGKYFPLKKIDYSFAFDKLPPEYIKEIKAISPIISWQSYADFKYPLKEITRHFRIDYFVNTVCYMIAYAIFNKVERLSLYGCDTFLGATWQRESKGVEFWLGIAHDRKIELILPKKSGLLKSMQGRPYDTNGREVLLTLGDRLILLKVINENLDYWDELYSATLRWILRPKSDESDRYDIHLGYDSEGHYTAVCAEEFRIDIPMAEDVWNYLRKALLDYERDFGLKDNMLGIYEMITTSEWRDGEYKKLPPANHRGQ